MSHCHARYRSQEISPLVYQGLQLLTTLPPFLHDVIYEEKNLMQNNNLLLAEQKINDMNIYWKEYYVIAIRGNLQLWKYPDIALH